MAGRSSPSSESDNESVRKNSETRKSFSIETLLKRTEPTPRLRWDMILHRQCLPKQVCPVPPNMVVPRRFFEPNTDRCNPAENYQCPDSSVSPCKVQEGGDPDEDCEEVDDSYGCSTSTTTVAADAGSATEVPAYKRKRPRTAFSVSQIRTLEAEFERNRYLTGSKRKELSKDLKLSETQIKIWFQNRRTKLKRKNVSEMENWVQQLYSPLGPMAPRPLVIGDHLYLFTTPGSEQPSYASPSTFHSPFEPWHPNPWSS